jgi:tetratricopeptide (TPR) repeat protein
MCAAARVFSKSSVMIIISLMIGCTWISNDVYEKAYDYHRKGKIALARRDYPEAQINLEQALQIWPSQMPDSSDKAAVHNNLGWALEAQKEPEKAIKNFEIGRTLFRKDVSCSHPFLAVLLNNYCDSRMSLNDWAGAQDTCFAAFTANTTRPPDKILSDVPPDDIAWGLFNWGVAWALVTNGESYYIPISKILEPDQPVSVPMKIELDPVEIADVYFQLGRLSLQRDNYADSERFHQRAFDIRDEKLGTIHVSTADSKAALGQVKLCQSRIQDAENDERQALGVRQTLLETGHPDIAKSYFGIGLVLEAQEKQQEALDFYWQAFHASVSALAVSISESFRQALKRCAGGNNYDSPEEVYIAFKKCRSLTEIQKRLTAMSLHGIGRTLSKYDPNAPTLHFEALALSVREATLGSNHPLTAQSHLAVGRAFEARQNFAEAEIHYRRAMDIAETAFGPRHRVTGVTFYNVGRVLRLQGRFEEASRFLNDAQSILQGGLPPGGILTDQYVSDLQGRIERGYDIDQLQGPETRATIAWDSPRLPRDHQSLSDFLEKKKSELLLVLQPGQRPEVVFKRFINMIDDPFDDFKHEVHGMKLFEYRVFWPPGFMAGSGDPCK